MKKIAAMVLAMFLMFSVCSAMFVSAAEEQPMDEAEVREKYIEYRGRENESLFTHVLGCADEYTIFYAAEGSDPMLFIKIFDGCIFMGQFHPYCLGVYAITGNDIYTLDEVYENNLADIETIAKISGGYLLGDGDVDWNLTVKDATIMQKVLAGFKNVSPMQQNYKWEYALDYNQDGSFDIKDVTALQKQLAQIVE